MENKDCKQEILNRIPVDLCEQIEQCNLSLIRKFSAHLDLTEVNGNNLKLSITNINGIKAPKAELLNFTYNTLKQGLNGQYRLTFKL